MTVRPKVWIPVCVAIGLLVYYADVSVLARLAIVGVVWLGYDHWRLLKAVEDLNNRLVTLDTRLSDDPDTQDRRQTSYHLQAIVEPDWDAILARLAQENGLTGEQLIERCRNTAGALNPAGWGLWYESFRFVLFRDLTTTREVVFSDHHRTFKERAVVEGHVFEEVAFRHDHGLKGSIRTRFIASPERVGFAAPWDSGGDVESSWDIGDVLAEIPVDQITQFLLRLDQKHVAMNAIKTFPDELDNELRRCGVVYSHEEFALKHLGASFDHECLELHLGSGGDDEPPSEAQVYSQDVVFHSFSTAFYTLRLRLHVHEAAGATRADR